MPTCLVCSSEIENKSGKPIKRIRKFCSNICSRKHQSARYLSQNQFKLHLPSATVGAIHELLVSVDLLRKGYSVFRSLSPSSPGDLAILLNGKLLIVEVTTASRTVAGNLAYAKHDSSKFDVIAVVEHGGTIHYFPDGTIT